MKKILLGLQLLLGLAFIAVVFSTTKIIEIDFLDNLVIDLTALSYWNIIFWCALGVFAALTIVLLILPWKRKSYGGKLPKEKKAKAPKAADQEEAAAENAAEDPALAKNNHISEYEAPIDVVPPDDVPNRTVTPLPLNERQEEPEPIYVLEPAPAPEPVTEPAPAAPVYADPRTDAGAPPAAVPKRAVLPAHAKPAPKAKAAAAPKAPAASKAKAAPKAEPDANVDDGKPPFKGAVKM